MPGGAVPFGAGGYVPSPQPDMTSNSSPSGYTMSATYEEGGPSGSGAAWRARNGNSGDGWYSSYDYFPHFLAASAPAPVTLSSYSLVNTNITEWILYGSNSPMQGNYTGATAVDSRTGQPYNGPLTTYTFPPATFRYWELRISAKTFSGFYVPEWRMA